MMGTVIGCRRRRSGNMRRVQELPDLTQESSMRLRGMPETRVTRVTPSGQRNPTPGAFTTWKVTSESGLPIFTPQPTTATAQPTIPPDPLQEREVGREVGG